MRDLESSSANFRGAMGDLLRIINFLDNESNLIPGVLNVKKSVVNGVNFSVKMEMKENLIFQIKL